jgi:guanylate kinase
MKDNQGKLVIVCAPSGSGKTTIVRAVLQEIKELQFSVSATSRKVREGEVHGKDYYFIPEDEFKSRIEKGDFLEWEEVYSGSFYGTLKSEVNRICDQGLHVIFDVDVIGGLNIKKQYPDNALAVFIRPPSIEELRNRLMGRGTETPETLEKRIAKAEYEIGFADQFDLIIVNDVLEQAISETLEQIRRFISK